MIRFCVGLFCLLMTTCTFAFPYYVSQDVLTEIEEHKAIYEQHPTSNKAMFDLAMSYAYSGQILKGWKLLKQIPESYAPIVVKEYEAAMKEDPLEWRHPFKCAFGYFFKGEKQKAIALFQRVVDIDPKQVWGYGFIGLVYGEMGEVDEAIKYCKLGLKVEPNATAIHFLLGEAYRKKGKYFRAFRQFLKVGRLQKKH